MGPNFLETVLKLFQTQNDGRVSLSLKLTSKSLRHAVVFIVQHRGKQRQQRAGKAGAIMRRQCHHLRFKFKECMHGETITEQGRFHHKK
ncbi:MAG: hypothetical protein JWR15_1898 [Prosthecobacter sp.]|nr:hypothetical protein [Prosthecobacter sp.]